MRGYDGVRQMIKGGGERIRMGGGDEERGQAAPPPHDKRMNACVCVGTQVLPTASSHRMYSVRLYCIYCIHTVHSAAVYGKLVYWKILISVNNAWSD